MIVFLAECLFLQSFMTNLLLRPVVCQEFMVLREPATFVGT